MERYHIFKLGLAIIFYAAYCIRPMLVYSLETDDNLENNKNILSPENDYFQYLHGVEGKPGRDFPVYAYIPRTNFNCRGIESGYYADLEADCQVFHICEEGKKISFLCPNGTIFQQSELICEWWNKVNCTNSPNLYEESAERLQNEVARRKSFRRVDPLNVGQEMNHGAVMRIEEHSSVRATKNGKDHPVRQQTQRTQRINNHRIPNNNDIEQQIEEAESNNRHLANAQSTQKSDFANQNQRYPNHNYNDLNANTDDGVIKSSRTKPTKKDIDKDTGNYINRNYDQDSNRQSKKVEQGEKNDLNFSSKNVQHKSSTLKEYHVEFGSTSSGVDSSTQGYNPSDEVSISFTSRNHGINSLSGTTNKYISTNSGRNNQASRSSSADSNISKKIPPQQSSTPKRFNENYDTSDPNNQYASRNHGTNSQSGTTTEYISTNSGKNSQASRSSSADSNISKKIPPQQSSSPKRFNENYDTSDPNNQYASRNHGTNSQSGTTTEYISTNSGKNSQASRSSSADFNISKKIPSQESSSPKRFNENYETSYPNNQYASRNHGINSQSETTTEYISKNSGKNSQASRSSSADSNISKKIPPQQSSSPKRFDENYDTSYPNNQYASRNHGINSQSGTTNEYISTNSDRNSQASRSSSADSNVSKKISPQESSSPKRFNENYDTYGTKVTNRNIFPSTTLAPEPSEQNTATIGKVNRGNVKYNTNPSYYSSQQTKDDQNKNQVNSIPVTTYSPPVKYASSKVSQNSQISNQDRSNQDNYDLPFPKHKSELSIDQSSVQIAKSQANRYNFGTQSSTQLPKQSDLSVSSTEAAPKIIQDRTSLNANEANQNNKITESDETQVPEESSSFVKTSFNSITDSSFKTSASPYPNHRSTYSDIKDISYLEAPKLPSISSITAHLVTTQPINNGKPFVGSRVGTTLLPNQPTTLSKYTYLPTTSTDTSKPTVIFGVIRHSSTTEPPPYGPPELLNLVSSSEHSTSDRFNIGSTDKTLPTLASTISITNPVPTQSFNVGNTGSTIRPNLVPTYGTSTVEPLNIFVPVHGSLNVGTGEANIEDDNPELKPINKNIYDTSTSNRFSFDNNNKVSPTIGINKLVPKVASSYISSTDRPLEYDTFSIGDRFNIGSTDRTRPTVETTTYVTNSVPTETFNVGNTDTTLQPNVVPSIGTSTIKPLEINVPDDGSLNLGQNDVNINDQYKGLEQVHEPPFIKKKVPLLYSDENNSISTIRSIDHATVYGTYRAVTQRPVVSSNKTPYSPTVPTVTQSSVQSSSPFYRSTTSRTSKGFNQGIPIRFLNGQDKISVQLTSNFGGHTQDNEQTRQQKTLQPSAQKINAVVRVGDLQQEFGSSSTTAAPYNQQSSFYVNEDFNKGVANRPKSKTEKPRPFTRTLGFEEQLNSGNANLGATSFGSSFPAYQISSARPFGVSQTTPSTPFITTRTPPSFSIYDNVDSMMNVLQEIANYNADKDISGSSRPGLVIPPSVGPQTLHSLAQYFANELQNSDPDKGGLTTETKEKLTSLLTAMTVHGYNKLFNTVESTDTPTTTNSSESDDNINAGVSTATRVGEQEGSEENNSISGESSNKEKDGSTVSNNDLLTTTSLPELRQLAKNFSLALSSYLHDPDNFKKSLEGLRPTEPPPLDGSDNVESSTTEDELLNFSDADVKPSTPAIPTATWGYIVSHDSKNGFQDEVKNSLNPDLNTADSQSFIPRFNNVQEEEKPQKGFTDLPPNHWTSSPQATKLWQKALSINPAVVNEHFETTPSIIIPDEETTEPELFNPDVLPGDIEPHSQISYDLRELPPLSLNSTQVHGILIDFMNHTKSDEHSRLNRILKKLNTSEAEFLDRMKEIESNPLTKRLVLLLISECGANITQDLGLTRLSQNIPQDELSRQEAPSQNSDIFPALESSASGRVFTRNADSDNRENHSLGQLLHPILSEDDQDARALQLLNSLYTIASRFGRKR